MNGAEPLRQRTEHCIPCLGRKRSQGETERSRQEGGSMTAVGCEEVDPVMTNITTEALVAAVARQGNRYVLARELGNKKRGNLRGIREWLIVDFRNAVDHRP